jgi:hypothetical protein
MRRNYFVDYNVQKTVVPNKSATNKSLLNQNIAKSFDMNTDSSIGHQQFNRVQNRQQIVSDLLSGANTDKIAMLEKQHTQATFNKIVDINAVKEAEDNFKYIIEDINTERKVEIVDDVVLTGKVRDWDMSYRQYDWKRDVESNDRYIKIVVPKQNQIKINEINQEYFENKKVKPVDEVEKIVNKRRRKRYIKKFDPYEAQNSNNTNIYGMDLDKVGGLNEDVDNGIDEADIDKFDPNSKYLTISFDVYDRLKQFGNKQMMDALDSKYISQAGQIRKYTKSDLVMDQQVNSLSIWKGREIKQMINEYMNEGDTLINFGCGRDNLDGVKCLVLNTDVQKLDGIKGFITIDGFYKLQKFNGILLSMALHHMRDDDITKLMRFVRSVGCKYIFIRDFFISNIIDLSASIIYDNCWSDHLGDTTYLRPFLVYQIKEKLFEYGYDVKKIVEAKGRLNLVARPFLFDASDQKEIDIIIQRDQQREIDEENERIKKISPEELYQKEMANLEKRKNKQKSNTRQVKLADHAGGARNKIKLVQCLQNVIVNEGENCDWSMQVKGLCKHLQVSSSANLHNFLSAPKKVYDTSKVRKIKSGELKLATTIRFFFKAVLEAAGQFNIKNENVMIIYAGCGFLQEKSLTLHTIRHAVDKHGFNFCLVDPIINPNFMSTTKIDGRRDFITTKYVSDLCLEFKDYSIAYFSDLRVTPEGEGTSVNTILQDNLLEMSVYKELVNAPNYFMSMWKFAILYDIKGDEFEFINCNTLRVQAYHSGELRGICYKRISKREPLTKMYNKVELEQRLQGFNETCRFVGTECYNCSELKSLNGWLL